MKSVRIAGSRVPMKKFMVWINALRSGKFKQAKFALQKMDAFCCLGVACTVLPFAKSYKYDEILLGYTPTDQPCAPAWLQNIDWDFMRQTQTSLVSLNDFDNFTFDEIADLLEAVYIHKVLA